MQEIKFSTKWNKRGELSKIDLKCLSSIRLDGKKWELNKWYKVVLNGSKKEYPAAKLVSIKKFILKNLTEYVSRIDTGYSKKETEEIIRKMYPNVDFEKKKLLLLTFDYQP